MLMLVLAVSSNSWGSLGSSLLSLWVISFHGMST